MSKARTRRWRVCATSSARSSSWKWSRRNLAIRIYGDTAVSNAEFTTSLRESGQVKTRRTRQTDVFVKRDGQWYLITEQGTMIGK